MCVGKWTVHYTTIASRCQGAFVLRAVEIVSELQVQEDLPVASLLQDRLVPWVSVQGLGLDLKLELEHQVARLSKFPGRVGSNLRAIQLFIRCLTLIQLFMNCYEMWRHGISLIESRE
jgi:hypothetical protein